MQEYVTIYAPAEDEFVERKSRFIGAIAPVQTEEEAQAWIAHVRQQHRDATHNTYAYILRNGIKRYSDDGEPQGTAGVPMLDCIEKEGLVDVAVVVTRYFGGILLGAGGLVRAYSGKVNYLLTNYVCRVEDTDFGAVVSMKVLFKKDESERFIKEVTELSAALIVPQVVEERFDHFAG